MWDRLIGLTEVARAAKDSSMTERAESVCAGSLARGEGWEVWCRSYMEASDHIRPPLTT